MKRRLITKTEWFLCAATSAHNFELNPVKLILKMVKQKFSVSKNNLLPHTLCMKGPKWRSVKLQNKSG
jgi:hypothetical protein